MIKLGAEGTGDDFEQILRYLLRTKTRINVNTATASEIALVLDISGAAADAVIARRTAKGQFKTLDELKAIRGVDASKVELRKDRIAF